MKRSADHILTTHTGSLPRPPDLIEWIRKKEAGETGAGPEFAARVREAVAEVVQKQVDCGIDVVSDGEAAVMKASAGRAAFTAWEKLSMSRCTASKSCQSIGPSQ